MSEVSSTITASSVKRLLWSTRKDDPAANFPEAMRIIRNTINEKYGELAPEDKKLVESFYFALVRYSEKSPEYKTAKNNIAKRVCEIYGSCMSLPQTSPKRLTALKVLANYSKLIRVYGITIPELKSVNCLNIGELRNKKTAFSPDKIPVEIKRILENVEFRPGQNYMKLVKENTNTIIFTHSLSKMMKTFTEVDIGTTEELTRSSFVEDYDTYTASPVKPWLLAATIVSNNAHISLYYKFNGNTFLLGYEPNERQAAISMKCFIERLLQTKELICDSDKKEAEKFTEYLNNKIRDLNSKLSISKAAGCSCDDINPQ